MPTITTAITEFTQLYVPKHRSARDKQHNIQAAHKRVLGIPNPQGSSTLSDAVLTSYAVRCPLQPSFLELLHASVETSAKYRTRY